MMGQRTVMQEALLYSFSLERHVPCDHMLRKIDRFIDLSGVRALLVALLQRRGWPSRPCALPYLPWCINSCSRGALTTRIACQTAEGVVVHWFKFKRR